MLVNDFRRLYEIIYIYIYTPCNSTTIKNNSPLEFVDYKSVPKNMFFSKRRFISWSTWTPRLYPIPTLYIYIYLPTFTLTIKINHSCRYILYHTWMLWDITSFFRKKKHHGKHTKPKHRLCRSFR